MSYDIIYDRRFISIGDKYIPIFQFGSNNTTEMVYNREVPSKDWIILNGPFTNKVLFTSDEITEIAETFLKSDLYKSRNKPFEDGQFKKYFILGMKHAKTVEEYLSYANTITISYQEPNNKIVRIPIRNTQELINFPNLKADAF